MRKYSWNDKEVEAHWDRVADVYVKENSKVKYAHDQRFRETIKYLDLKTGHRVLNITSRDGEADDYVKSENPGSDITNAEISQGLIDVASSIRPGIKQIKIDTYSILPFEDESFDRIISLETLEHAAEPEKFLSELHRVGKNDCRMVLSCPPATSEIPYQVFSFLFGGHGEGPHRFPSSKEVKKMLAASGWKVILHKGTVLIPVGPEWLQRAGESIIQKFGNSFISELGIRQFYVCERA